MLTSQARGIAKRCYIFAAEFNERHERFPTPDLTGSGSKGFSQLPDLTGVSTGTGEAPLAATNNVTI